MFMQRAPYSLLVKWEHHILSVQQGLVSCFTSANHRGMSRTEGELMRMLISDHWSLLLMRKVRTDALQHKVVAIHDPSFSFALSLLDPQSREETWVQALAVWAFPSTNCAFIIFIVFYSTTGFRLTCQGRKAIRDFWFPVWQKPHKAGKVQWPQSCCWAQGRPKSAKVLNISIDSCGLLVT